VLNAKIEHDCGFSYKIEHKFNLGGILMIITSKYKTQIHYLKTFYFYK